MIGRMMFDSNGYGHGHTMYHEAVTKAAFHFGTITEDHAKIITWLGQNPGLQSVQDVIKGVALDEKTVMKGLRHLVRTELLEIQVDEKHGVRRYQSTDLLKNKDQEEFITNRKILGNYLSGAWKYGRMRGFAFTLLIIAQMMIAQWSGMSGFGNVLIIALVVAVLSQLFSLGLPNAMGLFLPTYTKDHDKALFKGAFYYGLKYVCTTSIVMSVLCIFLVDLIPMEPEMLSAFRWSLATVPLWSIWNILVTPCIALKKWNSVTIPDYFVFPVAWIISLAVMHYVFGRSSVPNIIMCKFIANLLPVALQIFLTWRIMKNHCGGVTGTLEHERTVWWTKAGLLLVFKLIEIIRGSMLVIVGMLTMGAHAAGDLGVVNSALNPVTIMRSALAKSASPDIPRYFKSGLHESLHYLAHSMTAAAFVIFLLVLPLALIFGKDLLALYGNTSEATYIVFIIFIFLEGVKSFMGFPPLILELTAYQVWSILISLLAIGTYLLLVLVLVIPFKSNVEVGVIMIGIALATNRFAYIFACWIIVLRKLGLSTSLTALFIPEKKRILERIIAGKSTNEGFRIAELKSLGQFVTVESMVADKLQDFEPGMEERPGTFDPN